MHSRYLPVYRDSIDNIVGMLHTKDLVRWLVSGGTDATLTSVIRPITSVHESVTVDRVLRHLRERRTHQSLVVDEFGGTSGLITLEDVLSELLGDVGDEFKAGEPVAEAPPDGRFRLPGLDARRGCGHLRRDDVGDDRRDGERSHHGSAGTSSLTPREARRDRRFRISRGR